MHVVVKFLQFYIVVASEDPFNGSRATIIGDLALTKQFIALVVVVRDLDYPTFASQKSWRCEVGNISKVVLMAISQHSVQGYARSLTFLSSENSKVNSVSMIYKR